MVAVVKLHNMETAAVHIEVNVPLLKIRRDGLPDLHLRMQLFHLAPCRIPDSLAMNIRRNEENLQIAVACCLEKD